MYRCQVTGKLVGPGIPANRVVVERRERTYTRYNYKTQQEEIVGKGWEIVRELTVSEEGLRALSTSTDTTNN